MTLSTSTQAMQAAVLALVASLVSPGCGAPQAGSAPPPARAGDFALPDIEGRTVRLSDHAGKVVLLNFWATWCAPCAMEMPHLQRMYEAYGSQGFVVLAVAMDGPETVPSVAPHAQRHGLTFPVLLDEEARVTGMYNPKGAAPFTVLIGRDGAVSGTRAGYTAGDEIVLEAEIRSLIARP